MEKYKLGDLIDVKRGASLSGKYYSETGEKIRLTLGNFDYPNGGFKENTTKNDLFFTGPIRPEFVLKKGDIITPLTEQVAGLLGETAKIPESNKYIQSGDIGLVIPKENLIDKSYSYYLISSKMVKKQLGAGAQQTKIRHTSPDKIKDCDVWIPKMNYQKKAGKILDLINDKIRINTTTNKEAENIMKKIYRYWFMQYDFEDKNGKPYQSSGGKMVWNEELKKNIPEGWEVVSLKKLIKKNNRTYNYKNVDKTIDLGVMSPGTISLNKVNISSNFSTNLYKMQQGDILFGSIRPYLRKAGIAPVDGAHAGTVFSYSPINEYDYNFIVMTMADDNFFNYAVKNSKGTKMPVIGNDEILEYKVAYNKEVVSKFNQILNLKDLICHNICENIELETYRDYLSPLLINGQISFN